VIHTVFAGDAPADQPLSQWDRDCGFSDGVNVMEQRRNEERVAARRLGAIAIWGQDLLEGYRSSGPDLDAMVHALSRTIEEIGPTTILSPLGLQHNDHVAVASTTKVLIADPRCSDIAWYLYADKPYADLRPGLVRARLTQLRSDGLRVRKVNLPWRMRRGDLGAIRSYASQLQGLRTSARRLTLLHERVWRVMS
jgi:LmbE family N-acetylglucosaminyl deacetylase